MQNKVIHIHSFYTCGPLYGTREYAFWPGFDVQIKRTIETCKTCRENIFQLNAKEYLITVHLYSNFWEIDLRPTKTKSTALTAKLNLHFPRYGIHGQVVTDDCQQFKAQECTNFATANAVSYTHLTLPTKLEV